MCLYGFLYLYEVCRNIPSVYNFSFLSLFCHSTCLNKLFKIFSLVFSFYTPANFVFGGV